MTHTYKGYTPQIKREIDARLEREEINELINTKFEPLERRVFYTMLYCVLATIVVVPTVLHII